MFSYYGSKSKLAKHYPAPIFNKIVEPFAGSARYSLLHFENDITLIDSYQVVIDIWHYLQKCSPSDILGLPTLKKGDKIDSFGLSDVECKFLGMMAGIASFIPRNTVSDFAAVHFSRGNKLKNVADNLFKIKHWNILKADFTSVDISVKDTTFFIDPPYQFGGHSYIKNKIDYGFLAGWCKKIEGQAIVCENTKGTWMQFVALKNNHGAGNDTVEAIWTNI